MTSSEKSLQSAILKPDKEKSLLKRHPWIFSGALASLPAIEPGEILPVYSSKKEFLAQAYFNPNHSLIGRVLSFTKEPIEKVLREKFKSAAAMRAFLNCGNTFRLINGEEDGIPGLIVDQYAGVFVIQINTCGIERLRPLIIDLLKELFQPISIYEKSSAFAREQEGLAPSQGHIWGKEINEVEIEEYGIRYFVSLAKGQKTGFFLDQREMRLAVSRFAQGKRVLNTFSYSGGFTLSALKGGAISADSVDSDSDACELLERNLVHNGYDVKENKVYCDDVFVFLHRSALPYDLIILDPPSFAKKKGDVPNACKGFKELHRLIFEKVKHPAILVTSCCSYHIDEPLFQNLIFQSALEAGRDVKIIDRHHYAFDHPVSLNHPEGNYMKSLYLYIEQKKTL